MDAAGGQPQNDLRKHVEPDASPKKDIEGAPSSQLTDDTRLRDMHARTAALEATLADLTTRRISVVSELAAVPAVASMLPRHLNNPDADESSKDAAVQNAAKTMVKECIRRLNEYNEMRDIGQGLIGIIAESRGVRIKEVQEEFGIFAKD